MTTDTFAVTLDEALTTPDDAVDTVAIVCDAQGHQVPAPGTIDLTLEPADFIAQHDNLLTFEKVQAWLAAQGDVNRIEIRVPKFTDGRAFSVASRLREAGYTGELHASGDITQDVFYLLRRVGFSHFHLVLQPGETLDPAVLRPFGAWYQTALD